MSVYQELFEIEDLRHNSTACSFNGYLEDYLSTVEELMDHNVNKILKSLFDKDRDLRIITNLKAVVDKNQISNIIIRYKDIYKLKKNAVNIPMMVYGKNNKVILIHEDYITAKALYFVLSDEPNCLFENRKNTLAISIDEEPEEVAKAFENLNGNAMKIQKEFDKKHYPTIDDVIAEVKDRSEKNIIEIENYNHNKPETRLKFIERKIVETFLLKKYIYIQYMLDRDVLTAKHEGNVKKQRLEAKLLADSIRFIPYQRMWELTEHKKTKSK